MTTKDILIPCRELLARKKSKILLVKVSPGPISPCQFSLYGISGKKWQHLVVSTTVLQPLLPNLQSQNTNWIITKPFVSASEVKVFELHEAPLSHRVRSCDSDILKPYFSSKTAKVGENKIKRELKGCAAGVEKKKSPFHNLKII